MTSSRLLIIEDDPVISRCLQDNFAFHGYAVETSSDGNLGLQLAIAQPPDLLLLDLMLPGCNGFEICRELRQRGIDSTIIMLTAKGQEADIVRGLELGADDYVTKPFSIRELLARARAFLRRRQEPVAEILQFGPFVLDRTARRLRRGDEAIELTSKEYGLLEFLATRPGRGADAQRYPERRVGTQRDRNRSQRRPLRHHTAWQNRSRPATPSVGSNHSRCGLSL